MDTSSLIFDWSESGRVLLVKINQEIKANGGRLVMADLIMNEAPEFFSYKDRKEMDRIISDSKKKLPRSSRYLKTKDEILWKEEDLKFLKANYGIIGLKDLSITLKRSPRAIRIKFERICTRQEILDRRATRHYKQNTSITKYLKAEKELKQELAA